MKQRKKKPPSSHLKALPLVLQRDRKEKDEMKKREKEKKRRKRGGGVNVVLGEMSSQERHLSKKEGLLNRRETNPFASFLFRQRERGSFTECMYTSPPRQNEGVERKLLFSLALLLFVLKDSHTSSVFCFLPLTRIFFFLSSSYSLLRAALLLPISCFDCLSCWAACNGD